jgi:hypothetical protein
MASRSRLERAQLARPGLVPLALERPPVLRPATALEEGDQPGLLTAWRSITSRSTTTST